MKKTSNRQSDIRGQGQKQVNRDELGFAGNRTMSLRSYRRSATFTTRINTMDSPHPMILRLTFPQSLPQRLVSHLPLYQSLCGGNKNNRIQENGPSLTTSLCTRVRSLGKEGYSGGSETIRKCRNSETR